MTRGSVACEVDARSSANGSAGRPATAAACRVGSAPAPPFRNPSREPGRGYNRNRSEVIPRAATRGALTPRSLPDGHDRRAFDRPRRTRPRSATSTPGATAAAEGNGGMKDLLGGKGAGLAEMTIAGLPTPPGFTITTEACNDYFAAGEQLPDGLWDDVLEAMQEVERRTGKGFGDAGEPAPRQRPLRREVLDARDDGHGPQPRPERARRSTA